MMRNTQLPMQNQLVISSFVLNAPQVILDLGEFRFVSFVDYGKSMPFRDPEHSRIFFLVQPPNKNTYRLMIYRTFAWPIDENNHKLISKREELKIFSGEIDLQGHEVLKTDDI